MLDKTEEYLNVVTKDYKNMLSHLEHHDLVNRVLSYERAKEKRTNEWVNDRWYELKTKSRIELIDLISECKVSKLSYYEIEDRAKVIELIDKLTQIYFKISKKGNDVIDAGNIIEEIDKNNIKLKRTIKIKIDEENRYEKEYDIEVSYDSKIYSLREIVSELDKRDNLLYDTLDYVNGIFEFYTLYKDKYVVACFLDYDEIKYYRAKITDEFKSYFDSKRIEDCSNDAPFEIQEFIATISLDNYQGRNQIGNVMNDIKKEFPEGTKFVLVSL